MVYIYDDVYMYKRMVYVCVYMVCIYKVGKGERGWTCQGTYGRLFMMGTVVMLMLYEQDMGTCVVHDMCVLLLYADNDNVYIYI